jgi:hypothetical protein
MTLEEISLAVTKMVWELYPDANFACLKIFPKEGGEVVVNVTPSKGQKREIPS